MPPAHTGGALHQDELDLCMVFVRAGFGLAGFPSFPVFLPRTQLPPNPVGRIVVAPTKTWSLMHAYLKSKQDPRIRSPPLFFDDLQ